MSENGSDLVTKIHAEAIRRCREQDRQTRALVEQMHLEAARRHQEEEQRGSAWAEQAQREATNHHRQPSAHPESATIHYTQLPESRPNSPLVREWNTYRREVGRLLSEGQQGRWVLIQGERIIGTWNSEAEVEAVGLQQFQRQSFLIHRIAEYEPLLRGPSVLWRCRKTDLVADPRSRRDRHRQ